MGHLLRHYLITERLGTLIAKSENVGRCKMGQGELTSYCPIEWEVASFSPSIMEGTQIMIFGVIHTNFLLKFITSHAN